MTDRDKIEQEAEARIVAWLREGASAVWRRRSWRVWQWYGRWVARNAWNVAADAIARREHLPAVLEGDK